MVAVKIVNAKVQHNSRLQRTVHALRACPADEPQGRYPDGS